MIAIHLAGDQDETLEEVDDDVVRWFSAMLPEPGDEAYPILSNIDPDTTTTFGSDQMAPFVEEWRRLRTSGWMRPWLVTDGRDWERARVMSVIGALTERCRQTPGSRVVFSGA